MIGLVNLGGTCFLNSILQLLRATGILASPLALANPLAAELRDIFATLDAGRPVAPDALRATLQRMQAVAGARFRIFQPNDLHEFYVLLADVLTAAPGSPAPPPGLAGEAAAAWQACLRGNAGALAPAFFGLFRRDVRCGRCDARYENHETFSTIPLDLPTEDAAPTSLKALLAAHSAERDINADGGTWKCDRCGAVGAPAIARTSLVRAPDVFVFALNRYTGCRRVVAFPPAFNLAPGNGEGVVRYRCAGAAMHVGGASGGHCFAAAAAPDGRWALFDDDAVAGLAGPPADSPDVQLLAYALPEQKKGVLP